MERVNGYDDNGEHDVDINDDDDDFNDVKR